jgi:hypothetical protein
MSNLRQDLLLDSSLFVDDDRFVAEVDAKNSGKDNGAKNKRKRSKKSKSKAVRRADLVGNSNGETDKESGLEDGKGGGDEIEIELVPETIKLDKNFEEFAKVFEHFKVSN